MKNYYLIKNFEVEIGYYTEHAIRHKIKNGTWVDGREYFKSPDGHLFIDLNQVEKYMVSSKPIVPVNMRY